MTRNNITRVTAEPGKPEVVITREFDAPQELVFEAFTNANLYLQWLGPRGFTMIIEAFEPRNGGSWRYIQVDQYGNEYVFHGVNHEVKAPERIVSTYEFKGYSEESLIVLETARFEALPGNRTKLTAQAIFQSVEERDGELQSGMEEGISDSYYRLAELLEKIQNKDLDLK
jgi:uncharacterized protein YndB with AHSA1/START domain